MSRPKYDPVWWQYEYNCVNSKCGTHGYIVLVDNVNADKTKTCQECGDLVDAQLTEKYRPRSEILTPAEIRHWHEPVS